MPEFPNAYKALPAAPARRTNNVYYGPDQIGTAHVILQPTVGAQYFYEYDPLGTPTLSPPGSAPNIKMRFAHMWRESTSFLYLTHHRFYDPLTGRWLSRDPLGEASDPAQNLYRYAGGSAGFRLPIRVATTSPICYVSSGSADKPMRILLRTLRILLILAGVAGLASGLCMFLIDRQIISEQHFDATEGFRFAFLLKGKTFFVSAHEKMLHNLYLNTFLLMVGLVFILLVISALIRSRHR